MTKKVKRYAKFWTTMLSDEWFLGLNNSHRGIFMQLILNCKNQGDDGYVVWTSRATAASVMGTERRCLCSFLDNNATQVTVLALKPLNIKLLHYNEWQEHTAKKEESPDARKMTKKSPTRPDQTILNQTIAEAAPKKVKEDSLERFNDYVETNQENIMAMGQFHIKGKSPDELWSFIKIEIDAMRAWIIANPQKANKARWGQFVNNWLKPKDKPANEETGMSYRQEQEHFADKERLGSRSKFKPIGEVLSDE